jgi:uncharacterized membrane protein YbhN (UPF0104 family)
MWDAADDLAAALERLLSGLAGALAGAHVGWLALGAALHVANQIARGCGWHAIVRTATDGDPALRRRDSIGAWVAGAGAGGVVSARGGDAVRILLLRLRLPKTGAPRLAGTLVAEGAGELATGVVLLAVAVLFGVGPHFGAPSAAALWIVPAAVAAVGALVLLGRRVAWVRRVGAGVAGGCAQLRCPRAYAVQVLPWQLASRLFRAAALACFLAAFGLPVTPAVVLLVMFAQGSARLLPFAPASVGAGAAMLAATFEPVTGTAVPAGQVAAFFLGTSTALTVVGTVLALTICLRAARWQAFAEALRGVRRGAQAEAAAVRSVAAETVVPPLEPARSASMPRP